MSEAEQLAISLTPILDSGTLPPRTRRKLSIGTVAGFVGAVLVGLNIVKVVGEQASQSTDTADGILIFFVALTLAVLIHELGHLSAGWLLGFRFGLISVGPVSLQIEHGKLKLSFLRDMAALGYAGMHVDTVVRLRHRILIYATAGTAANVLTIPIAVLFANHTSFAAAHPLLISFAAQLAMISFLLSVGSLVPVPLGASSSTDGFMIATLLKNRERTRRILSICAIAAQQQKGVRPKSWKQTWLRAASSVPDEWIDDFWGNLLAYISAGARKDEESAGLHLERSLKASRLLTHTVRDLAAQEAAIFSAWYRRDALVAEKWMTQIKRPKLVQPLTRHRMAIATCCARAQFEDALRSWDEGFMYIKALPETPLKETFLNAWLEWRKEIGDRQNKIQPVATAVGDQA